MDNRLCRVACGVRNRNGVVAAIRHVVGAHIRIPAHCRKRIPIDRDACDRLVVDRRDSDLIRFEPRRKLRRNRVNAVDQDEHPCPGSVLTVHANLVDTVLRDLPAFPAVPVKRHIREQTVRIRKDLALLIFAQFVCADEPRLIVDRSVHVDHKPVRIGQFDVRSLELRRIGDRAGADDVVEPSHRQVAFSGIAGDIGYADLIYAVVHERVVEIPQIVAELDELR